jgi:saccharopine dehydrogenase-like NADP-dependent oxidoreductase
MYELDTEAKAAGILLLFGLGGCPGINNVLVRAAADQLDSVEEIHTAWVMSGADPGGRALSYHLLHSLSGPALTVMDGALVEVESFIDGREVQEFPDPVGPVEVFHVGHPEPLTLSRTFPSARTIDNKATFIPSSVNLLIRTLGELQRRGPDRIPVHGQLFAVTDVMAGYLHRYCKSLSGVPPEAALRVTVSGRTRGRDKTIGFSSVGRLASATGIPAAIGALMIARGSLKAKGALPPEACIDAQEFLYEILDRRKLADLNGWTEE